MSTTKCPMCGSTRVEVTKTWNLVSPLPDRLGRITVTVMGVIRCSACGYSWRATISKLKIGEGVEMEGKREIAKDTRPPKEIILDLDEILGEGERAR